MIHDREIKAADKIKQVVIVLCVSYFPTANDPPLLFAMCECRITDGFGDTKCICANLRLGDWENDSKQTFLPLAHECTAYVSRVEPISFGWISSISDVMNGDFPPAILFMPVNGDACKWKFDWKPRARWALPHNWNWRLDNLISLDKFSRKLLYSKDESKKCWLLYIFLWRRPLETGKWWGFHFSAESSVCVCVQCCTRSHNKRAPPAKYPREISPITRPSLRQFILIWFSLARTNVSLMSVQPSR